LLPSPGPLTLCAPEVRCHWKRAFGGLPLESTGSAAYGVGRDAHTNMSILDRWRASRPE